VAAAAARYDASEADVALQTAAATEAERASAEAQLAQAQAQLASLLADPAAEDVAAAEAEIAQAELALADAEQALAEAAITAPFAGVVTAVSVSPGEYAAGVVVSLIDAGRLEVVLAVDETDVGSLEVGQPAALTLETWPDVEIPASVAAIAPQASSAADSALVTYDVHLRLGDTDLPVRAGMTANASLITAQRTDVLLVPNQAISADRGSGTYSVNRVDGDTVTAVPVTIGLRDSQYTQITSGIAEGDQLLIGDTLPLQQFGPNSE
ncbi:MAG: efflux RND transporter periplasmic adaptor subunit, partial [Anaerolineales bacterium]|nr:efflux RND transporter periplasmic adaptor subunit [Anaerolineales bacterium]